MTDPLAPIRAAVAGRYEIEREIGQGAFATVYLARDLRHERRVAFKVLNADPDSELSELRFLREIRLLANLQHPNILPLIDSGHAESMLYYVMPYVSGETLRVRIQRERQLAIDAAVTIAREAADALACAHSHGIVHRDIKPENILLSAGHPMLADFGVARAIGAAGGRHLTRTGSAMPGTPSYMSPEQLLNEGHELDGRSDTYSLGCVLFEMLTGRPPFAGKDGFVKRFTEPPPRPSEIRREIPAEIDDIVTKTLARAPDDRYNAGDLCRALAAAAAVITTPRGAPALRPKGHSRETAQPGIAASAPAHGHVPDTATMSAVEPDPAPMAAASRTAAPMSSVLGRFGRRVWIAAGLLLLAAVIVPAFSVMGRDRLASGRRALEAGRLGEAVSDLRQAATNEPASAVASLWLAQALLMAGGDSTPEWKRAALAASAGAGQMMMQEAQRAQALAALAERHYVAACAGFQTLRSALPQDPSVAFSLAECLARDSAVVRDSSSASGWRFRADRELALGLYQELLDRLEPGHDARRTILARVPGLLTMEWGRYRPGHGAGDSTRTFGAFPSIADRPEGSGVVYVPYPLAEFRPGQPWMNPPSMERAWERDRDILRRVGLAMVAEQPTSAAAHATLARALELGGELGTQPGSPSALDEIRTARKRAGSSLEDLRLRSAEVRLLVKRGELGAARALADSTLAAAAQPTHAASEVLAPLAALTGRATRLVALLSGDASQNVQRMPDGRTFKPHPVLGATTLALSGYAKVGGPRDSIVALRARAERQIRSYAAPRAVDSVRSALLARSISLAVPVVGADAVVGLPRGDALLEAQRALARRDVTAVRATLDSLRAYRAGHSAAAVRLEQVYQEAWLRAAIGDTAAAAQALDDALDGMPALGTLFLTTIAEAGALAPAMVLRSRLAEVRGDGETARRWSAAAKALRQSADPELRPDRTVRRRTEEQDSFTLVARRPHAAS